MAVKPVLLDEEMARAILEGRKTQMRRAIKPQPRGKIAYCMAGYKHGTWNYPGGTAYQFWGDEWRVPEGMTNEERNRHWTPPYNADDILWARETWAQVNESVGMGFKTKKIIYRANYSDIEAEGWKWRPSTHMPREAARIFLHVTDVRVERLREITDDQALAEGVKYTDFGMYQPTWKASLDGCKTFHPAKPIHHPGYHVKDVTKPEQCLPSPRGAFANLWDSTIKSADREEYGWAVNPLVWVISFERCEKPEGFDLS